MPDFGADVSGLIIDDRDNGIFRVHRSAFVDEQIFQLERELIFDRSWLFAGHVSQIPNPGDFVSRRVGGRPVIIVHGDDGEIRVLLNTCRHRGNLVCREQKGNSDVFRCFYHGWIYNNRGELKGIPGEEAYSDAFDRESLGLEPVPRMHNYRGLIFVSFYPEMEAFEAYMSDALAVLDNVLNLGDMEFVEGNFKYSMRAYWKLLVENSMDGYHGDFTHERFFTNFMPAMGFETGGNPGNSGAPAPGRPPGGSVTYGNGHAATSGLSSEPRLGYGAAYLKKYAGEGFQRHFDLLASRHGPEKARMIENGSGNCLIFPNLVIVSGWFVFRTFYPVSPDYMEVEAWACMPKEDSPELRAARLEWYLGFQGPGGFATPDDVEGLEGCQMGFATHKEVEWSDISRGMHGNGGVTDELQMRAFWREWHARLTGGRHASDTSDSLKR